MDFQLDSIASVTYRKICNYKINNMLPDGTMQHSATKFAKNYTMLKQDFSVEFGCHF
jgi:hypothetical protein